MGEINSFPISTNTFSDLDALQGEDVSASDKYLIYDQSQGLVKAIDVSETRKYAPFIYETVAQLVAADLPTDTENPFYVKVEETGYRLYKIINTAPEAGDILLDNGNVAVLQEEYQLAGFVQGPSESSDNAIAVFDGEDSYKVKQGPVIGAIGGSLIESDTVSSASFIKVNPDSSVTFQTVEETKTDLGINDRVSGPASSLADQVALFDGVTGKLLKAGQTLSQYFTSYLNNFLTTLYNIFPRKINTFADLANTPAAVNEVVFVREQSAYFYGVSGSVTSDGYSKTNSSTSGVHWLRQRFELESTDTVGSSYTQSVTKVTGDNADAILANHTVSDDGQGYAVHALDSGASSLGDPYIISKGNSAAGGAGGFATSRTTPADAIVANRRSSGDGSGVVGSRWEDGNGNGVMGVKRGTGVGDAVLGYKVLTSEGHAVQGINESSEGSGVYGWRRNGAGPGAGVSGYAEGSGGGGSLNPSVYGFKLSTDNGHAGFFESINAAGNYSVLTAVAFGGTYSASEINSDSTNTSTVTAQVNRGNGLTGVAHRIRVSGFGERTGLLTAGQSFIQPADLSTGAAAVIAHDAQITTNVTGSADTKTLNANNASTGGVDAYGLASVVTGVNTTNYAVYGNATGATTNWSGYFVGNVYHGGTLTPSDSRLKDIHGVVDGAKCLENVLACPVYCYDKYSAWDDLDGNEQRQKILINEVGPIAQELQAVTPDHVIDSEKYLAVNDRSELYQIKAAVQFLAQELNKLKSSQD